MIWKKRKLCHSLTLFHALRFTKKRESERVIFIDAWFLSLSLLFYSHSTFSLLRVILLYTHFWKIIIFWNYSFRCISYRNLMRETLSFGIDDGKKYDWRMLQRFTGRHKKQNFLSGASIKLLNKLSTLINFRFLKNNVIFFKFYVSIKTNWRGAMIIREWYFH